MRWDEQRGYRGKGESEFGVEGGVNEMGGERKDGSGVGCNVF